MKLFEVTIKEDGITIRREMEEHLKADQKFTILLSLIGVAGVLGFIICLALPFIL